MFYEALGAKVEQKVEETYNHVYPIDAPEDQWPLGECDEPEPNFEDGIINCGYDLAGDTLRYLLPNIVDSDVTEIAPRD